MSLHWTFADLVLVYYWAFLPGPKTSKKRRQIGYHRHAVTVREPAIRNQLS
jgi:hypothetical protein